MEFIVNVTSLLYDPLRRQMDFVVSSNTRKDWHGDADWGDTAITTVIPAVMGTFVAVIPWEWRWSHINTMGIGLEFVVYPR